MRVVGVTGGVEEVNDDYYDVEPSRGLLHLLRNLDSDTSVGIDLAEELVDGNYSMRESYVVHGNTVPLYGANVHYWNAVLDACAASGVRLLFLRDWTIEKRLLHSTFKLTQLSEEHQEIGQFLSDKAAADGEAAQLGIVNRVSEERDAYNRLQEINHAMYSLHTELQYIRSVENPDVVLRALNGAKIDVALLGRGCSGYVALQQPSSAVKYSLDLPKIDENRPVLRSRLVKNIAPSTDALAERDRARRAYDALTRGRIQPSAVPDFIGTSDFEIPARGLFELYITSRNGNSIEGLVEDTESSYPFTGALTPDRLALHFLPYGARDYPCETVFYAERSGGGFVGSYLSAMYPPICRPSGKNFDPADVLNEAAEKIVLLPGSFLQ